MEQLKNLLNSLITLVTSLDKRTKRLIEFAEAIKIHEGWFPGSRSFRNKNPGNLKYVGQRKAIGEDQSGFAIFKTYDDGFYALFKMLDNACEGYSEIYKAEMTLLEFFAVYAPRSDNNDPVAYAMFVADRLKVEPNTKLKDLFI